MSSPASYQPPGSIQPGVVLGGRYVIEQSLGQGGFGQVYRARQEPLGRLVAVKVLLASTASLSPGQSDRFKREAQLAMRLEHPNTVRVLDIGVTDAGLPFIVWELLRGLTLGDHLLSHGPMSDAQVVRVTSQLLKSLMEAHGLGVIHRDIKPANVFVTSHPGEELFVKLLDFGIAKDLAAPGQSRTLSDAVQLSRGISPSTSAAVTGASQTLGTPRYMAPEQLAGDIVGPPTDLYAVGLVMSEMLSGRPVYDAESALQLLMDRSLGGPAPLPPEAQRSRLFPIIARATALAPASRFGSAQEMLGFLEQSLTSGAQVGGQAAGHVPSGAASGGAGASQHISQAAASLRASQLPSSASAATPPSVAQSTSLMPAQTPASWSASPTHPSAAHTAPLSRAPQPPQPSALGAPQRVPAPPPARPARSRGPWLALAIGAPLAIALGVGGVLWLGGSGSRSASREEGEAPTAEKTAKKKTSTAPAPGPDRKSAEAEAAPPPQAPAIPLKDRAIPALTPADVKKRLTLAGFTAQSEPTETKSELGRYVNQPIVRGECFGAVHYYDYVNEGQLVELEGSLRKMVSAQALHRSGARMVQITFTGRAGVPQCETDAMDAMTR